MAKFLRDLQALKREERVRLKPDVLDSTSARLLLVEGFLLYYSPTSRAFFDKKIFIDLPEEEIIRRRLARSRTTLGGLKPVGELTQAVLVLQLLRGIIMPHD